MPTSDDLSYARTAQLFADTGHFIYNGWATAMLGWQIVWGALFIKLFGFSFLVLRASTILLAIASAVLLHRILLRFGIEPRNAAFGTLIVILCPQFLAETVSFMTDIPGVLCIFVCIYGLSACPRRWQ
ncbi:MAG: glycosyltransferase family 39 protein [Edaphobacter sp.]